MNKSISILIPVYNSAEILPKLAKAIDDERAKYGWDLELVLVEDGSHDGSFSVIKKLKPIYPFIRGFKLSRNFGQQSALSVGLANVTKDYVAIIDDDFQDPPYLLNRFFEKLDEGYDVVYGVRKNRKESLYKRAAYKLFYLIVRKMSDYKLPIDSGDFCAMKLRVVKSMLLFKERNPYLRGIRSWVGYKQIGIDYERPERAMGETGWTLRRLIRFAFDGIYSFSDIPVKLAGFVGSILLIFSISYGGYLLWDYFSNGISVKGFATIALLILGFGSVNLIFLGILGEYVSRIYNESKERPHAIIDEVI